MRLGLYLLAIIFALPLLVSAQGFESVTPQNNLVLDPAYPQPGELVTIRLEDYAGGTYGSQITWRYNGETIDNSINQRSVEITAGNLGERGVVEAVLLLPNGTTQTLTSVITPVYLDIVIEPQTRVPDWYQGRAMPSIGSQINVTAIVNDGSIVDPAGLVYSWQVNRKVLDAGPVRGRNKMSFTTPRGNNFILSLTVSRTSGEVLGSRAIQVESPMPQLAFYEQHSLYGSKQFPINSTAVLIGNAITVQAEPFFLDTRVYNNPDVAIWEINGLETNNGTRNPYEITLQRAAATGRTNVGFHVRSLQEVLQGAESTISVNF